VTYFLFVMFVSLLTVNKGLPRLSLVCTRFSWLNPNSFRSEYLAHDHTCISHDTTQFYAVGLYSYSSLFAGIEFQESPRKAKIRE